LEVSGKYERDNEELKKLAKDGLQKLIKDEWQKLIKDELAKLEVSTKYERDNEELNEKVRRRTGHARCNSRARAL